MPYASPQDLWRRGLSPVNLFQDRSLEPGAWSEPVHTAGAGLGHISLHPDSNPRDAQSVRIEIVGAGENHVPGRLNRLGLPTLRMSLDGGTSWLQRRQPDPQGLVMVREGGFTLQLRNGVEGATVNFGTGDAQIQLRGKHWGLTFVIVSGTVLSSSFDEELGQIVLTVTGSTTANQAVAYLANSGLPVRVTAGGTGAGIVQVAGAAALPYESFVTSDAWTFATSASPDVLAALQDASDLMDGFFRETYALPLVDVGSYVKRVCCNLARWELIVRKGLHTQSQYQPYEPKAEMAWLKDVKEGNQVITATETGKGVSFPLLVQPIDPLSREAGTFPI